MNLGLFVLVLITRIFFKFYLAQQPPVGYGLLILEVSRSHTDAPQSVGVISWSQRPLP